MADGIIRPFPEEYLESLQRLRRKILQLRSQGKEVEERFYEEYGGYWFIEFHKDEMVKYGIIAKREDW